MIVLGVLLVLVSVPAASAQTQVPADDTRDGEALDFTSFARPYRLERMVFDPWMDGFWIGTDSAGLFFKPWDGTRLSHHGVLDGMPSGKVYDIDVSRERVWVGTEFGPAVLDKSTGTWSTIDVTPENGTQQARALIASTRTVFTEGDTAWVGTDTRGLYRVDPGTAEATHVPNPVNDTRFDHPILGLDHDGSTLFISATGYGLVGWDRAADEARKYGGPLYEDRPLYGRVLVHGPSVWVGTSGDGVIRWNRTENSATAYVGPDTINARHVLNVVDLGPEIWMATDNGVPKYNAKTDDWTQYDEGHGHGYDFTHPTDVVVAKGEVFATTRWEGYIVKYNRTADAWERVHWWRDIQTPDWNEVHDCDVMDDGRLLVSTAGGLSAFYDPATGEWATIPKHVDTSGAPADIYVKETAIDGETLWFATNQGVSWWDRSTDTWDSYRTDGHPEWRGVRNSVKDLAVDPDRDAVWAASFSSERRTARGGAHGWTDGNLAKYDKTTGEWTNYTTEDGLPHENLTSVEAGEDYVWIGGTPGIVRFDPVNETFETVYPEEGIEGILSLSMRDGTLYAGTLTQGLVRYNTTTGENSTAVQTPYPVTSQTWDRGDLWAGTPTKGFYKLDPAAGDGEAFHTGMPADFWAHCFARQGEVLYVGTQWGVQRLHLPTQTWLPQVIDPQRDELPSEQVNNTGPRSISIEGPGQGASFAPGSQVPLNGTATAPEGAEVQVRVGSGAWQTVDDLSEWSTNVTLPSVPGTTSLWAQLVWRGSPVAQDVVDVEVRPPGSADDGAGPAAGAEDERVEFEHNPLLETVTDLEIDLRVRADQLPSGVSGQVQIWAPGETSARTVDLEPRGSDRLTATLPAFEETGEAEYVIELTWDDGHERLPSPYSAYGDAYPLMVRQNTGAAIAQLVAGSGPATALPGESANVTMTLQNVGTNPGEFGFTVGGPAASWLVETPSAVELAAGSSQQIRFPVDVPSDASPGEYDLDVTTAPTDPTAGVGGETSAVVEVAPPAQTTGADGGSEIPVLGAPALLVVVLVTAGLTTSRIAKPRRGRGGRDD